MLLSNLGYKEGFLSGFQDGYKEGYNSGLEDCLKPGQEEVLTKIPDSKSTIYEPETQKRLTESFKNGSFNSYHDARF